MACPIEVRNGDETVYLPLTKQDKSSSFEYVEIVQECEILMVSIAVAVAVEFRRNSRISSLPGLQI